MVAVLMCTWAAMFFSAPSLQSINQSINHYCNFLVHHTNWCHTATIHFNTFLLVHATDSILAVCSTRDNPGGIKVSSGSAVSSCSLIRLGSLSGNRILQKPMGNIFNLPTLTFLANPFIPCYSFPPSNLKLKGCC